MHEAERGELVRGPGFGGGVEFRKEIGSTMDKLLADPHSARLNPAERVANQRRTSARSSFRELRSRQRRMLT
ncbi:MAG: hypothetical protein GY937_27595 [bacterium]|nr:hypothetical protein [bacterium]